MERYNKSKLFKIAHLLKNQNGLSMSLSLTVAWRDLKLVARLYQGGVEFEYFKKDNERRRAFGTLRNIEYQYKGSDKFQNDILTTRYFDLEKQEFRAFKVVNLISID